MQVSNVLEVICWKTFLIRDYHVLLDTSYKLDIEWNIKKKKQIEQIKCACFICFSLFSDKISNYCIYILKKYC